MINWIKSFFEDKKVNVEHEEIIKPKLEIGGEGYTKELIATLKDVLSKYENYERIYFYGSRARGDNRPDSDYDFYIVFNEDADDIYDGLNFDNPRIRNEILGVLAEHGFNDFRIDLMMAKENRFQILAQENDSHVWQILNGKGRLV